MIVDEIRCWALSIRRWHQHHITGLEIAIEEALATLRREVFGKHPEVGFQLQLVEIELRGLQETILEIVQVEEHAVLVELRLRIAIAPVQPTCATNLNVGQCTDGVHQQLFFALIITPTSLTSAANGIEERHGAKVGLQVSNFIAANCQYLGNWQLSLGEVAGEIDERMVLVAAGAHHAYHGFRHGITGDRHVACITIKPVILAIAASASQSFHPGRLCPTPFAI